MFLLADFVTIFINVSRIFQKYGCAVDQSVFDSQATCTGIP